ncbi:unnamed protein product [Urochloa decumbens]|uniref:F-box domain-containing protein n=1 Tax=Urochloa decumbens TaxID=240449 RepID=A0ABC8YIT9_9POAL
MDLTSLLPEDVLADVLRRLAPRWLAASRGVCRSWRAAVDGRGLLRDASGLLPRSLAGIFIHHSSDWMTSFLCRPSAADTPASADLHYTFSGEDGGKEMEDSFEVRDHCNGLVLLQDVVANPRARHAAVGTPAAAAASVRGARPRRLLVRRRVPRLRPGHVAALRGVLRPPRSFSLSSGKYRIIRPPVAFKPYDGLDESYARRLSIGKSEKGVYSVLVYRNRIKVWILDDSNGQFKWVSKQLVGHLPKLQERSYYKLESKGPWVLQGINSRYYSDHGYIEEEQGQFEWDSDNDDVLPDDGDMTGYKYFVTFLGFHPYKEVIFLNDSFVRVLAYHLNSSKIQDLGYVFDKDEVHCLGNDLVYVERSFPYTPCWMTDFPQNDQ